MVKFLKSIQDMQSMNDMDVGCLCKTEVYVLQICIHYGKYGLTF